MHRTYELDDEGGVEAVNDRNPRMARWSVPLEMRELIGHGLSLPSRRRTAYRVAPEVPRGDDLDVRLLTFP